MSLSRWKMMAGVLGVSIGGLAAAASQCPKFDKSKGRSPEAPVAKADPKLAPAGAPSAPPAAFELPQLPSTPAVPAAPNLVPAGPTPPTVAAPEPPKPATVLPALPDFPSLPAVQDVKPAAGTLPQLPTPPAPTVPTGKPSEPVKLLPAPTPSAPVTDLIPPLPAAPNKTTPPAPSAPMKADVALPPIDVGTPPAPPQAFTKPSAPPTVDLGPPPATKPGSTAPAGPGTFPAADPIPSKPVDAPLLIDAPPSKPTVAPAAATVAAVPEVKFRILLRVGEGEPTFEVKNGDNLVLKVACEKVDIDSTDKGTGLSKVTAKGKVRFAGFGAEGSCDTLSFMAGTGEVQMTGDVKVQVKDKLGRVESELTTATMKYKIDASAVGGALKP